MSLRSALILAAAVVAAPAAAALPLCEEDGLHGEEPELEARAEARIAVEALPVVPCAMVESGVLGPACSDATFYVVTDAGVMLCTVDVDLLHFDAAPTHAVETAPAAPAATLVGGAFALGLVPGVAGLPVRVGHDILVGPPGFIAGPLERSDRPPVPPS